LTRALLSGGVEKHVREGPLSQRAVAEGGHLLVKVGTDAAHLGPADAGVGPKRLDQVIDFARAPSVQPLVQGRPGLMNRRPMLSRAQAAIQALSIR
jgi:hypothetical protein